MASVILYGLLRRIRSSRVLEYMTGHNVDFMWLTEGRTIDHSTICKFRTRFKKQLKALFRGLSRLAMTMGLIRLGEVTFDGTRVKANNGRYETWTAAEVEKRLAELEAEFGQALEESERVDAAEEERFGLQSPPALPPELADAKARQQRLLEAHATGRGRCRSASGGNQDAGPIAEHRFGFDRLAKQGRWLCSELHADGSRGYASGLHCRRRRDRRRQREHGPGPDGRSRAGSLWATPRSGLGRWSECDRAEYRRPGTTRGRVSLAVGGQRTQGGKPGGAAGSPAAGPRRVVAEVADQPAHQETGQVRLRVRARREQVLLSRGAALPFEKSKPDVRQGQKIILDVYRCGDCAGCPLAERCVSDKNQGGRTVTRDRFTPDRERHAAKMQQPEARTRYARRFHAGETPFGWLKHVLGLRQFLLRGLEKVRMEWLWACTGYNLRKLILAVGRLRGVCGVGCGRGKLTKLGASGHSFFRAEAGLASVCGFGKSFRSFRSSKKHEIARRATESVVLAETKSTARLLGGESRTSGTCFGDRCVGREHCKPAGTDSQELSCRIPVGRIGKPSAKSPT